MRIARAVIAPDAATHRVKGRVDRSDSRPSRRMGGLSSWRRAFYRLAFQPRGVCADTGVYAVVKEQRRERRISLSYTSRKIGLFITPSVEIFQNSLQMGKPFANGMMHGRLSGVFSCSDLQLRQSANYVRNAGVSCASAYFSSRSSSMRSSASSGCSGRFSASASMPSPASSE